MDPPYIGCHRSKEAGGSFKGSPASASHLHPRLPRTERGACPASFSHRVRRCSKCGRVVGLFVGRIIGSAGLEARQNGMMDEETRIFDMEGKGQERQNRTKVDFSSKREVA